MKHTLAALAAIFSLACLTFAPSAKARSIRADSPGNVGCQLQNWSNPQTLAGPSPFTPGGVTFGASGTDYVVTCNSNSDNSTLTSDKNSFFNVNSNVDPPYPIQPNESYGATQNTSYKATSGVLYQIISNGSGANNNTSGFMDSEIVAWTLSNTDIELELNNWCSVGAGGASLTWGKNTFSGGCSSSTNDLLFNKSGNLIGYVKDLGSTLTLVTATSLPTDWTSAGVAAPEIDPSSTFAALTLLAGGLAVLRGSRRTVNIK